MKVKSQSRIKRSSEMLTISKKQDKHDCSFLQGSLMADLNLSSASSFFLG